MWKRIVRFIGSNSWRRTSAALVTSIQRGGQSMPLLRVSLYAIHEERVSSALKEEEGPWLWKPTKGVFFRPL